MRALLFAVLAFLTTTAAASADAGSQPSWLADPSVLAMSTITLDNVRLRALVTADGNHQQLVIESVDRWSSTLQSQRRVETFETNGYAYALATSATGFDSISFQGTRLGFSLFIRESDRPLRCSVDTFERRLVARCGDSSHRPRPPRPQPAPPTNWAAAPHVIAACDTALYAADKELACLEQASFATYDPTAAIAACDSATYGDDNTVACIARVVRARVDVVPLIAACDAAMYGDENVLACLDNAATFRFPPAATIAACDAATYGDPSTLACVTAASRFAGDATATIQACDAATYGDEATIACIERGGAY